MTQSVSQTRAAVSRIAQWLLTKGRPTEAVAALCAWAVSGPNDAEGQTLLAAALRIDPASEIARMAFERMEGLEKEQGLLAEAIARFTVEELTRIEREMNPPSFRRAQVGFNNNLKYKDRVFHVQTEDSGLDKPHIITHLFADGGRIIKSHKRSYADSVLRADIGLHVRSLMKAQQLEMVLLLREGRFDDVIEGRRVGGMELLEHPPSVDVRKLTGRKKSADASAPSSVLSPPKTSKIVHFRLHVQRSLSGGPDVYEPPGDECVIGSEGVITLPGERFCHPKEAAIRFRDGKLYLEDFEGGNGVFLRIRTPVEVDYGDEFIIGDELLRIERNAAADDGPDSAPTYFYSSPKWPSSFRVAQIFEGGAEGACVLARGTTLQIGSTTGDLIFPNDALVSETHCLIEEQAQVIVLADLGSRTGVFVRIEGEQELANGDEMLVGRTRLVLEVNKA